MTLKRVDPWSMLKFGAALNVSLLGVALLAFGVVWFFVSRLGLVDQTCEVLLDVGWESCAVNGGNLFKSILVLGILTVVIATGLAVFVAFLINLVADLVGGPTFTFLDETRGDRVSTRSGATFAPEESADSNAPTAVGDDPSSRRGAGSRFGS